MSLEATPELTNATKRQTSTVNTPHFMILFTLISLCHAHIILAHTLIITVSEEKLQIRLLHQICLKENEIYNNAGLFQMHVVAGFNEFRDIY